jgi:hypothetical protein
MTVPQSIPLMLADDGRQGVELHKQLPVLCSRRRANGKGIPLTGLMHDAEAVDHHVCDVAFNETPRVEKR